MNSGSSASPKYQDYVKHKLNDISGVVIAVYDIDDVRYFDVRTDDRVYYKTIAGNWIVVMEVID